MGGGVGGLLKFLVKKVVISCSVLLSIIRSPTLNNIYYELSCDNLL
jgi:hypothetical protein